MACAVSLAMLLVVINPAYIALGQSTVSLLAPADGHLPRAKPDQDRIRQDKTRETKN